MRQELHTPIPSQKFSDRLGGDHPSVIYSADERRAVIEGIAHDAYRAMGYSIRRDEVEGVSNLWCEMFDCIPDTELEQVRLDGIAQAARTPGEYVDIFEQRMARLAKKQSTRVTIEAIRAEKIMKPDVPAIADARESTAELWRKSGLLAA